MKQRISSSLHTGLITATPFAVVAPEANDLGIEVRCVGETIVDPMDAAGRAVTHSGDIEELRGSAFAGMYDDGDKKGTYGKFIHAMRATIRSELLPQAGAKE